MPGVGRIIIGIRKNSMQHKWSQENDIVAFYLYKFGPESLMMTFKDISKRLGMSEASLIMRVANFKAIDGVGGLENYAKQSKRIYNEYKNVKKGEYIYAHCCPK